MSNGDDREHDEVEEASEESFPASDPPAWTTVTGIHAELASKPVGDMPAVENDESGQRFVVRYAEGEAELRYRFRGKKKDKVVLVHTEVPAALAGRGIAGRLARTALEWARARGLSVVPMCPFVKAFVERHPEFNDLISH